MQKLQLDAVDKPGPGEIRHAGYGFKHPFPILARQAENYVDHHGDAGSLQAAAGILKHGKAVPPPDEPGCVLVYGL